MSRVVATVVVALGGFGSEVARRLAGRVRTRPEDRAADLATIELPLEGHGDDADLGRMEGFEERLVAAVESQLALDALVERSAVDASPPWLDLIVVGDAGDAGVRAALGPVLDAAGRVVSGRFGHLLGREGRRVVAIPILALGGVRGGDVGGEVRESLEALARRRLPRARAFLVEAQTAKYLLSASELVSSVVAMIELLVLASLRDHERVASFLRDEAPRLQAFDEPATFGSFGVATVRVSGELVRSYCRNRAALEVVEAMRAGDEVGLAERETLARELRLSWDEVRDRLGLAARSDAAFEQVEKVLDEEAPDVPCPPIETSDTPEQVRDLKFGDGWHEGVSRAIDALVERMERRRMPELVEQIDGNGLSLFRERRARVAERVDRWIWSEPRGWAGALSAARLLRAEAAAAEEAARERVARAPLPERPGVERIAGAVAALRGEAERRPRPFRMWLTGLLVMLPALLFGYGLFALLGWGLDALDAPPWLADLARPPWGMVLTAALAVAVVAVHLRDVVRRRHAELCEVQADLRRAIERLLTGREGSILAYYVSRLALARDLWALRLARGERRRIDAEIARLEEVQRALDGLREELRAAQRRLGVRFVGREGGDEDLSHVEGGGDLILREAGSGALLAAAYAEAVPDEESLGPAFFETLRAEEPRWRGEVPMADLSRIEEFLDGAIAVPSAAELLGRGAGGREDPAGVTAREAVQGVLSDLAARLSPALEVHESAASSARTSWAVCSPEAAEAVVDEAIRAIREEQGTSAFAADWLRLASPRDDGQIYLAVLVTHLPVGGIGTVTP